MLFTKRCLRVDWIGVYGKFDLTVLQNMSAKSARNWKVEIQWYFASIKFFSEGLPQKCISQIVSVANVIKLFWNLPSEFLTI